MGAGFGHSWNKPPGKTRGEYATTREREECPPLNGLFSNLNKLRWRVKCEIYMDPNETVKVSPNGTFVIFNFQLLSADVLTCVEYLSNVDY